MDDKKKVQEAILEEHGVSDDALGGVAGACKDVEIHCPNCRSKSWGHDHKEYDSWGHATIYIRCMSCGTVYEYAMRVQD